MKRFRRMRHAYRVEMRRLADANHIPCIVCGSSPGTGGPLVWTLYTSKQAGKELPTLESLELEYIEKVLAHVDHNRTRAAEILGIDRTSLWRKMKKHENT